MRCAVPSASARVARIRSFSGIRTSGEHGVEGGRHIFPALESNRGEICRIVHPEVVERAEESVVEGIPEPRLVRDAVVEPYEHRLAVRTLGRGREPEEELRGEAREEALVARRCRMVELVHNDDVEGVGSDVLDAGGERLHRGEDMAAGLWSLAADEPLAEAGLAQDELEDLLALAEDLVPVCDEEEGVPRALGVEPAEVERGDPRLPGSGRRDHEVPAVSAYPLRLKCLESNRLVGFRGNVDRKKEPGAIVAGAGAPLPRERAIQSLGVTLRPVLLELGLLPVLFEGRLESLDNLGVLGRAHPHVPFESLDLSRVGEVRRADVGGVKTALAVEEPRLGMEPRPGDLVGDLHLGPSWTRASSARRSVDPV